MANAVVIWLLSAVKSPKLASKPSSPAGSSTLTANTRRNGFWSGEVLHDHSGSPSKCPGSNGNPGWPGHGSAVVPVFLGDGYLEQTNGLYSDSANVFQSDVTSPLLDEGRESEILAAVTAAGQLPDPFYSLREPNSPSGNRRNRSISCQLSFRSKKVTDRPAYLSFAL